MLSSATFSDCMLCAWLICKFRAIRHCDTLICCWHLRENAYTENPSSLPRNWGFWDITTHGSYHADETPKTHMLGLSRIDSNLACGVDRPASAVSVLENQILAKKTNGSSHFNPYGETRPLHRSWSNLANLALDDVIICAKFGVDRFKGSYSVRGRKWPFPILTQYRQ
jgi:hypothetical protein